MAVVRVGVGVSFCRVWNCVRDLLAGRQGQPSARPWHLLIDPSGLQPFPPHRFVSLSLMSTEAIAYLITISSSSIDSPVTHARLACSLPYAWASMPHKLHERLDCECSSGGSIYTRRRWK